MIEVAAFGAYPTRITMDLTVGVDEVEVTAYDPNGDPIWSDTRPATAEHFVEIEEVGDIAYVVLVGHRTEVWIDNVCVGN